MRSIGSKRSATLLSSTFLLPSVCQPDKFQEGKRSYHPRFPRQKPKLRSPITPVSE